MQLGRKKMIKRIERTKSLRNELSQSTGETFHVYEGHQAAIRPLLLLLLSAVIGLWTNPAWAAKATSVDCVTSPVALSAALVAASPGDTLHVLGTCIGVYTVDKNITIAGAPGAALDGNGIGPVVTVEPGVQVTLDNLIVTGGVSRDVFATGGILNQGALEITRSKVIGNMAFGVTRAVGGIESGPATSASILIDQTEISDNTAAVTSADPAAPIATATGGVRTHGPIFMIKSEVLNNRASASSVARSRAFGAMTIGAGGGYLDRITVADNTASSEHTGLTGAGLIAGAIGGITHLPPDLLVIEKSVIQNNHALATSAVGSGSAGGMVSRMTTLIKTEVTGNTAEARTLSIAGIANHNAVLVLDKSDVTGNMASVTDSMGVAVGGIITGYFNVASTSLSKSSVLNNSAFGGTAIGGLYQVLGNGTYELDKSQVENNQPVNCNFPGCTP